MNTYLKQILIALAIFGCASINAMERPTTSQPEQMSELERAQLEQAIQASLQTPQPTQQQSDQIPEIEKAHVEQAIRESLQSQRSYNQRSQQAERQLESDRQRAILRSLQENNREDEELRLAIAASLAESQKTQTDRKGKGPQVEIEEQNEAAIQLSLRKKQIHGLKEKKRKLHTLNKVVKEGNLQAVKNFVETYGYPDFPCDPKYFFAISKTPLTMAIKYNNFEIVKYLVSQGFEETLSFDPIYCPTSSKIIKYLAHKGLLHRNYSQRDLCLAIENGCFPFAKYILSTGSVDVNRRCNFRCYPIHHCSSLKEFKYLIEKCGANPKVINISGDVHPKYTKNGTLLHSADLELAKYLIEKKHIDVNHESCHGYTPLTWRISTSCTSNAQRLEFAVIKYFVENGADVNYMPSGNPPSVDGTPLHIAVQSGNIEVVKFLLEHGALINAEDKHGKTPAEYAGNNQEIATLLKKYPELQKIKFVMENQDECPICLEENLTQTNTYVSPVCQHGICKGCMEDLKERERYTCPTCSRKKYIRR